MYTSVIFKILLLGGLVVSVSCTDEGEYYWRPWTSGAPPHDALTMRDYRGASYIVQAYASNYGVVIGQVFANQHVANITVLGSASNANFIIESSSFLMVLCTQSLEKLAWYPTNSKTLQNELVTAVVNPVLGGVNVRNQVVYIGRYVDTNLRIVVVGSIVKDYALHYHHVGKPYAQSYYEILVIGSKCLSY